MICTLAMKLGQRYYMEIFIHLTTQQEVTSVLSKQITIIIVLLHYIDFAYKNILVVQNLNVINLN